MQMLQTQRPEMFAAIQQNPQAFMQLILGGGAGGMGGMGGAGAGGAHHHAGHGHAGHG